MILVDSHCHLHDSECFPGEAEEYLSHAVAADVRQIVVIGTSCEDSLVAQKFAASHPGVFWTYGVHPSELEKEYQEPNFEAIGHNEKPIAIGEVGLDYHYGPEDYGGMHMSFDEMRSAQFKLLEKMIDLGLRNNLPFCFHVREAFDDFFGILDNFSGAEIRGVIHSFTDNKKNLKKCLERGFYIGVNGMATYSTLPKPPLDRVLLETDAPYLAPLPHRGERNEPAYIRNIAEWVAENYNVSLEEVAEATSNNFRSVYHISANDLLS